MPARPSNAQDNEPPEQDPLAQSIGIEISRALGAKQMSVVKLHQVTGISRTVLQGYIKGRYKPGAREIREICRALDCSPNRLLFGRESFRERSPLDDLVGDADKMKNSASAGAIFQLLTLEEQRAFLSLLALFVEKRTGREGVAAILHASRAAVEAMEAQGAGLEQRLEALATPEVIDAVATKVREASPPKPAPPPPTKRPKARKS
jgi:DNA-binding Xre family transcriptional regulator